MYSNIKSRKLGVNMRRVIIAFLLIVTIFTMVGCQQDEGEVTTQEFELVTCYIEYRNVTNGFGGVVRVDEYLHYGYVDESGKVIFDEMSFGSYLNFQVTDETPKTGDPIHPKWFLVVALGCTSAILLLKKDKNNVSVKTA